MFWLFYFVIYDRALEFSTILNELIRAVVTVKLEFNLFVFFSSAHLNAIDVENLHFIYALHLIDLRMKFYPLNLNASQS